MGPKKKVEPQQQPVQVAVVEAPKIYSNSLIILKTEDEKQYKLLESLAFKYSPTLRNLWEESKEEVILIPECSGEILQLMVQWFNLHKENEPQAIQIPIRSNQTLRTIMELEDSLFVEKVLDLGDETIKKIIEMSNYLQVEDLRKRMLIGLSIFLMSFPLDDLKREYDLEEDNHPEEELRIEMKAKIETLRKMDEE